jgi:hypothetical protein
LEISSGEDRRKGAQVRIVVPIKAVPDLVEEIELTGDWRRRSC